jgi:uncharacterized OB-fold protein
MEQTSREYIILPCGITEEMNIPYNWGAGAFVGKALEELRDNGTIYANQCPQCGRFHLPPRMVCGRCHVEMEGFEKWVKVGPQGTVLLFTVTVRPFLEPETGKPRKVPYTVGTIQLDGAPVAFEHLLKETDPEKITVGMRVEAVFKPKEQRTGDLRDILHFKTLNG